MMDQEPLYLDWKELSALFHIITTYKEKFCSNVQRSMTTQLLEKVRHAESILGQRADKAPIERNLTDEPTP